VQRAARSCTYLPRRPDLRRGLPPDPTPCHLAGRRQDNATHQARLLLRDVLEKRRRCRCCRLTPVVSVGIDDAGVRLVQPAAVALIVELLTSMPTLGPLAARPLLPLSVTATLSTCRLIAPLPPVMLVVRPFWALSLTTLSRTHTVHPCRSQTRRR